MKALRQKIQDHWIELVAGAVGLQLIVTAIALVLGQHPLMLALIGCAVLLLLALMLLISEWVHRPRFGGPKEWEHVQARGIVFTLGRQSYQDNSTVLKVLARAQPQLVGFVGTRETAQAQVADTIAAKAHLGNDAWIERTVDPTDVADIRAHVQQLIGWMEGRGIRRSDQL